MGRNLLFKLSKNETHLLRYSSHRTILDTNYVELLILPDYIVMMSHRNDFSYQRSRHFSDPTSSRHGTKYHRRGGKRNNRPEPNRQGVNADDIHSLTVSIDRALTTDGNTSQDSFFTDRAVKHTKNSRASMETYIPPNSKKGWWRITISEAGKIGKQLVLEALQAKCLRPFLPYHVTKYFIIRLDFFLYDLFFQYNIETRSQDGVFFVNNQTDADALKRLNGKVEVRGIDTVGNPIKFIHVFSRFSKLRVLMCRVPVPNPSINEDAKPHLKVRTRGTNPTFSILRFQDHLLTRRFDQITCKLDLTNLTDDDGTHSYFVHICKYSTSFL